VFASPAIISVKNRPIESTIPEFWKVAFIPAPAPRARAGRLFITSARFGEENRPMPTPLSSSNAAKAG